GKTSGMCRVRDHYRPTAVRPLYLHDAQPWIFRSVVYEPVPHRMGKRDRACPDGGGLHVFTGAHNTFDNPIRYEVDDRIVIGTVKESRCTFAPVTDTVVRMGRAEIGVVKAEPGAGQLAGKNGGYGRRQNQQVGRYHGDLLMTVLHDHGAHID